MTDKETLILAAKAAGYELATEQPWDRMIVLINGDIFSSLHNDGDCFRLETELELELIWEVDLVRIGTVIEWFEDHNGAKDKARRYASTRAAALIGRE